TLINKNNAIALAGDGYPSRYTAQAKDILPELDGEPPEANAVWSCGPNDQLSDAWSGDGPLPAFSCKVCCGSQR
ncbi:MAG: hypothetical protein GY914_09895, partial [Prochlorococcus sp.]|nr:hypothetical protein [Prochlorococcus sp.]